MTTSKYAQYQYWLLANICLVTIAHIQYLFCLLTNAACHSYVTYSLPTINMKLNWFQTFRHGSSQYAARGSLIQGVLNYIFGSYLDATNQSSHSDSACADLACAHDECRGPRKKGSRASSSLSACSSCTAYRSACPRTAYGSTCGRCTADGCSSAALHGTSYALCRTHTAAEYSRTHPHCRTHARRNASCSDAADRSAQHGSFQWSPPQWSDFGRKAAGNFEQDNHEQRHPHCDRPEQNNTEFGCVEAGNPEQDPSKHHEPESS